jgi:hypothetical protein
MMEVLLRQRASHVACQCGNWDTVTQKNVQDANWLDLALLHCYVYSRDSVELFCLLWAPKSFHPVIG